VITACEAYAFPSFLPRCSAGCEEQLASGRSSINLLDALLDYARAYELGVVRLETGDKQRAAIAFYRRRGFVQIPRFGPYLASKTSVCMQRRLLGRGSENAHQR
jgi:hypothetical protein